jgi:hypothetical protein
MLQNARLRGRISFSNRRRYAARAARRYAARAAVSATTTSILPIAGSFLDPPRHRPFQRGRDERRRPKSDHRAPGIIAASAAEGMLTRFAVHETTRASQARVLTQGALSPSVPLR